MGLIRKPAWNGEYLPHGAAGMTVAPVRVLRSGRVVKARRGGMGDFSSWLCSVFPSQCIGAVGAYALATTAGGAAVNYGTALQNPNPPTLAKAGGVPTAAQLATVDPSQLPVDLAASQFSANQETTQRFFADLATQQEGNATADSLAVSPWFWLVVGGAALWGGVKVLEILAGGRR